MWTRPVVTCGVACGLRDLPCLQSARSDGLGAPSTVGQLGLGRFGETNQTCLR